MELTWKKGAAPQAFQPHALSPQSLEPTMVTSLCVAHCPIGERIDASESELDRRM